MQWKFWEECLQIERKNDKKMIRPSNTGVHCSTKEHHKKTQKHSSKHGSNVHPETDHASNSGASYQIYNTKSHQETNYR